MEGRLQSQMSTTTNIGRTLKRVLMASGWLLLCIGAVFYIFEFVRVLHTPRSMDYWWYSFAFHAVFSSPGPSHMYDVTAQRAWVSAFGKPRPYDEYVYPPQFAFLFSWLSIFSVRVGEAIWAILSIICYGISLFFLQRLAYRGRRLRTRILLLGLGLFVFPYLSDMVNANSDWLLFFLLTMTFDMLYRKAKPVSAGVFLGLAVVCKVTPVLVVLYLLLRREWRAVVSASITAVMVTLVTLLITGISPFIEYATRFFTFTNTSMKNGAAPWNSSFLGVLQHWSGQDTAHVNQAALHIAFAGINLGTYRAHSIFNIYLLFIGCIFVFVALMLKGHMDKRYDMALAALSLVLFSPLVELHYLLFLLIPVYMLFGLTMESPIGSSVRTAVRLGSRLVIASVIAIYVMIEDVMYPLHGVIAMIGLLLLTLACGWLLSNQTNTVRTD